MATESSVKTQWQNLVKIYNEALKFASRNVTNFVDLHDTLTASFDGDFTSELAQRVQSSRARLDGLLREFGAALDPLLRTYGQVMSVPETDAQSLITRLYNYYIDNGVTVKSRSFDYGDPTADGGNDGNGVIIRLNIDENGYAIENQHEDAKVATCIADSTSGAEKWEEVFEIRGASASKDTLELTGSGARAQIAAVSARASSGILKNPSFSQYQPGDDTANPTSIDNWEAATAVSSATFEILDEASGADGYYRGFPGDTAPYAIRFKASNTLSQDLEDQRSRFVPGVPYMVQLAWRRKNSATGTLSVTLGGVSTSVSIASGTNDVWNILRIPVGTNCWYKNFKNAALTLSIQVATLAVGQVDIDDVIITPFASFDGGWYCIVGTPASGAPSQWMRDDKFTWTDTSYVDAIIQEWLWRGTGRYLPARPAAPSAPSVALAGAGAGNVENGAHTYYQVNVDVNGVRSYPSSGAAVTVVDKTSDGKVTVTLVAADTNYIASREIYRSTAGTTTPGKLLTTVNDPATTTTYTDNTADASLGANATTGTTFSDPA